MLSSEGAQLLADAVVSALDDCPEGRWVYNEAVLKEGFELRVPWHLQTSNARSAFSELYPEL